MIDSNSINREIQLARIELNDSTNIKGILSLRTRKRVWKAMLDPEDTEGTYRRRTSLRILCVEQVKHHWYRAFPHDERVDEMIALTQDVVEQREDADTSQQRAENFLVDVLDEIDDFNSITEPASFVADAASSTVISACHRYLDYDIANSAEEDDERLPDALDTSYCCASAAAGALNWQPLEDTDVDARRAFWLWYLDEAIPAVLAD
ncbi:Imm5 family immunity protein [Actinomyces oris]|uniref:Imm5 family immunity protein n=1 Tax=Actinomyces oris TaxID=544580 RepID=UPI00094F0539|nr:Imm5 family immunity protein [Actinomyces oris]OLO53443.1 immunity protein [Actinomyces oris]